MSELNPSAERDPSFNPDDLYREDTYTDRRIGTIRVLTPVLPSGERDPAREVEFSGQISVMTPMGALPVGFDLPGPRLLPAALVPFLRVIALPLLVSALGFDVILYVVSKWLEWPCWSSLCLLLG